MRSRYAVVNGIMSLSIFIINGIMAFLIRKFMLPLLGSELVGLTATFSDILVFLNLADMGISGSIGASLYEPINRKQYARIKGILMLFKKLYRFCGILFTIGTLAVSVVLKFTFKNPGITGNDAALYFALTAVSVGLSYFFSYRLIILSTDQRMFKLKIINSLFKVVSAGLKIFVLFKLRSFVAFLLVDISVTLLYLLVMNLLIKWAYQKVETLEPRLETADKTKIVQTVKGLILHQIGGSVVCGTNNLYTAIFAGLTSAAILSNYQMIVNIITGVIDSVFSGFAASIGNLIAAENTDKRYSVFQTIFFVSCGSVTVATVTFVNCAQPFVSAWFGRQYMTNVVVVYLMAINFYISMIRPATEQFKNAAGLFYQDRYVPLVEGAVNAVGSLILGYKFGMEGVIAGNILSTVLIISWQKPYMTFKYIFKKPLTYYFKELAQYVAVGAVCMLVSWKLCQMAGTVNLWLKLSIDALISIAVTMGLFWLTFFRTHRYHKLCECMVNLFKYNLVKQRDPSR